MQTVPNMLKNRDRENIEKIEGSFRNGSLKQALESFGELERRDRLAPRDFENEYRKRGTPVIIRGLMDDWPAMHTWTFDYLASKCGSARVMIDSYSSQKARQATFSEFVEILRARRDSNQPPVYLQEWLYMPDCPFLAEDLPELPIAQYDFRRELYGEKISTNHQLWIGQKGATTRIHQDSYFIDVMHAQIVGRKHWCVMSPEATLHRDNSGGLDFGGLIADPRTRMMQCILEPGEVLYLPAQWWHRIELVTDSIGLGRKCLDQVHLQKHIQMRLAELLPLALNHEQVKKLYPELYNVVILRNQAWAKLLDIDLEKLRP